MPKLNLSFFHGDGQSAHRWLAKYASTIVIGGYNSKFSGKAEDWMNQTRQVRNIMDDRETATIVEVKAFETEYKSRFPG
ncbi:hypothetical protein OnM2_066049 [Erysiphe neolycopersici]|uniref:Uncharacterized protein n=1 Tax=Erysiphe neolycopersici TaxID=212602 RepID=A0A420HMQ1_9PEZI|nr:hypothetical protein OnM2_066049 [Erysiphe neolycopersici]